MKYKIIAAALLAGALFLHLLIAYTSGYSSIPSKIRKDLHLQKDKNLPANLHDVFNETLGFQEVRVISLVARTDKRDAISLQARLTNISFTFLDGAVGAEVSEKAKPYTMNLKAGAVGAWRSHLNVMQEMVRHQTRSVLVFEDDADWDVAIKAQMLQVARGTRWLLNMSDTTSAHSPYGDGWDVIWLGHCGSKPYPGDNRRWVIPKDPTVLPPHARWSLWMYGQPDMKPWESGANGDNQTRVLYVPSSGTCIASWAISLAGAEKILYWQSLLPFKHPVDEGVGEMCKDKVLNLTCIAPWPQMVGISRPAGVKLKDSDIEFSETGSQEVREKPVSHGMMFPVRQNIERLIAGRTTFKSQHPEVTGEFMTLEDIGSGIGHGEWV